MLDVIPPVIVLRLFCSREVLRFIVIYIECVLSDIDVCGVCCLFAGYNKQLLHPPVPSLTPPPLPQVPQTQKQRFTVPAGKRFVVEKVTLEGISPEVKG